MKLKNPRDRIKISAQNTLFNNKTIDYNKPKRFRYTDKNFLKLNNKNYFLYFII